MCYGCCGKKLVGIPTLKQNIFVNRLLFSSNIKADEAEFNLHMVFEFCIYDCSSFNFSLICLGNGPENSQNTENSSIKSFDDGRMETVPFLSINLLYQG